MIRSERITETDCSAGVIPVIQVIRGLDDPPEESAQGALPVVITAPIGSAGLDLIDDDDPAWGKRPA